MRDITAALGVEPAAVIPEDASLARAADLGRLPSRPGRALRAIARLATALEAPGAHAGSALGGEAP